jgi:hypothetical protein
MKLAWKDGDSFRVAAVPSLVGVLMLLGRGSITMGASSNDVQGENGV